MDFIGNTVFPAITEQVNHHRRVDENMNNLKRKCEELNCRKEDVEAKVKTDLKPGKKLKKEVELWLATVQKINEEKQRIENDIAEGRYLGRLRLGKLIVEKIQEVEELHVKGSFSDGLVVDAPPSNGVTLPTTTLIGKTTAVKCMNDIWAYLMGNEVRKIGVCGIGGVGKTNILKHINNRLLKETDKFDNVIWVSVSREVDVIKLQNDIAHSLNQDLVKHEDKITRAGYLLEMLEWKKRCVLILDDVWENFSLEEVGIPEPTLENGCKIVLTTRKFDVCRYIDCKVIKVQLLTDEEAWSLFLDKVGIDVLRNQNLVVTVKLVAEQCSRLPLAIVTVASSLKGVYNIHEWRNALNELRERIKSVKGMGSEVFERLKFSYDRLKDLKVQHCFLYCTLYPENFDIPKRELFRNWIAEGLVDEMTSREAEYDRCHVILNTLENSCLLESTEHGYVKMHDLVRDMALNFRRANSLCMVRAGMKLQELPNEEEWAEDLEKVSLMWNSISEIPSAMSPKCQRLSTLLLQGNFYLKKISYDFFACMPWLKVLDLSNTCIESLPNSISKLENLTALLLNECERLKYVPSLAKLKALRTLDLSNTGVKEVPAGLEECINLRSLNLRAYGLEMLPTGIIPKLPHLQCLILDWGLGILIKVKGDEVAGLRKLETFGGQFYDLHDFNTYVRSLLGRQGPRRYLLQVGPGDPGIYFDEEGGNFNKHVELTECSISREAEDPLVLPNDIEFLSIRECHDVSSLCDISSLTIDSLKYCGIVNCDGIECLLSSSSALYMTPLQSLEVLKLAWLRNLHILFRGDRTLPPPPGTFSLLKELLIHECPNIKKVFKAGMLRHLQNLEVIELRGCKGLEEIIEVREQGTCESREYYIVNNCFTMVTITLPKLRTLVLWDLPELKSVFCSKALLVCDSLEDVTIHECPKLKRLPLYLPMLNGQPYPPPALQKIIVDDRQWWESLEWDQPTARDLLRPFLSRW